MRNIEQTKHHPYANAEYDTSVSLLLRDKTVLYVK